MAKSVTAKMTFSIDDIIKLRLYVFCDLWEAWRSG